MDACWSFCVLYINLSFSVKAGTTALTQETVRAYRTLAMVESKGSYSGERAMSSREEGNWW